jgi:hypothetical protein
MNEGIMKRFISLLIISSVPLAAQSYEVGVFLGKQDYRSITTATNVAYIGRTVESDSKSVQAIRLGYTITDFGPFLFQATVGYQPEVTTDTRYLVDGAQGGPAHYSTTDKYWSVGAMLHLKAFTACGAGIEYRSETLSLLDIKTTYGRPWFRLNAGFAFPGPSIKPFVGLEVSAPLTSYSSDLTFTTEDFLKRIAPKIQMGVYGGIRF